MTIFNLYPYFRKGLIILILTSLIAPSLSEVALAICEKDNIDPPHTLSNKYVSLTVSDSGAFTMQRTSDNKWLLYPSPETTALSIKVDNNVYWTRNGSLNVSTPLTVVDLETAYIEYITPENILVKQTFKLVEKAVKFSVDVQNNSSENHQVKVRYLFDTQVDENDGSPLYAEGITDSQGSSVCTYEVDIPSVNFSEWKGYDIWQNCFPNR